MLGRPPSEDRLRRIEARLNALLVLLAVVAAAAVFAAARSVPYAWPALVVVVGIAVVLLAGALVAGTWLTPVAASSDRDASEDAAE